MCTQLKLSHLKVININHRAKIGLKNDNNEKGNKYIQMRISSASLIKNLQFKEVIVKTI